jgi:hypothetical protein
LTGVDAIILLPLLVDTDGVAMDALCGRATGVDGSVTRDVAVATGVGSEPGAHGAATDRVVEEDGGRRSDGGFTFFAGGGISSSLDGIPANFWTNSFSIAWHITTISSPGLLYV